MKTIAFVITSKCEEDCTYCFQKNQKDLTLAQVKKSLSIAIEKNPEIKKVVITGGNPELNKDFWAICNEIKSKKLLVKVHSNFINKESWNKFFGLVDEVSIPIDSIKHHPFRSERNTKNCLDAFNFFLGKIRIQVHTVVSKKNLTDLGEIRGFLDSKGFFGKNSWKLFRLVGVKALKGEQLSDKEWEQLKDKYSETKVHFVDNILEY